MEDTLAILLKEKLRYIKIVDSMVRNEKKSCRQWKYYNQTGSEHRLACVLNTGSVYMQTREPPVHRSSIIVPGRKNNRAICSLRRAQLIFGYTRYEELSTATKIYQQIYIFARFWIVQKPK